MYLRPLTIDEESEISNAFARLKIAPTISAPSLDDYYHVTSVPDKGQVCLASRPITRGTRILEEAPLFSFLISDNASHPSDPEAMIQALELKDLTLSDLNHFIILNPVFVTAALNNMILDNLHWFKALGFVKANDLECCVSNACDIPIGETMSPIFVNASRFNHSCSPNAFCVWNENLGADHQGRLTIHAIRDIAFGEEILINYLNEDSLESRIAQKKKLHEDYGFVCNHPACDPGAPDAARVEDNRKWIREIIRARGSADDPTAPSRRQRYLEFVELQKLDELLETEAILYPQRARGYGWMAEWCARELSQKTVVLDRQECRELGLKAARNKLDLDIVCNGYMSSEIHK